MGNHAFGDDFGSSPLLPKRTIKHATLTRYHYDTHDQLRRHLYDVLDAYNYARRLKTLSGLSP